MGEDESIEIEPDQLAFSSFVFKLMPNALIIPLGTIIDGNHSPEFVVLHLTSYNNAITVLAMFILCVIPPAMTVAKHMADNDFAVVGLCMSGCILFAFTILWVLIQIATQSWVIGFSFDFDLNWPEYELSSLATITRVLCFVQFLFEMMMLVLSCAMYVGSTSQE